MEANIINKKIPSCIIHKINDHFKVPIHYNESRIEIKKNLITDLELVESVDVSCNPIYSFCFNNDNDVSYKINEQITRFYTTDIEFLRDNQTLLKTYVAPKTRYTNLSSNYKNILDIWNELKTEDGFKEKYYYVDWETLEFLNTSEIFLQFMSIYNLMSPLISFIVPIIILIIPFFILKIKGLPLSMYEYIEVLKVVAESNAIGKLFTVNFADINTQERIYIFVSAAFYIFSIYQNIMVCIRFNNNMKTIHKHFQDLVLYLDNTIDSMDNYLTYSKGLSTHTDFNNELVQKIEKLSVIRDNIKSITEYNMYNINKIKEIGKVLKYFYELHTNVEYNNAILYSLGFNGYIDCIKGLQMNIVERKMNYAIFITNTKKGRFSNSYYACLKEESPIKNDIKFKKNMIITGPNASGKTTILKSTLINIILTQQFGCGFYDSAKFAPFKHIHCYLNIPDTSGRDSLFQAEARRCKEILDTISAHKTDTHFCAFDELYSGTNPDEAETSATAFMMYLQKYKKVSSLLTTHFIKVCKKLDNYDGIQNFKMVAEQRDSKIHYKYKITNGISEIKGGINILTDMNYPKEIIENTVLAQC